MRARTILIFTLLVGLLATASLSAQTFRGTILGTVTDPSGAVLPGAKVTVKNTGTGLERTTETSADGSYSLPELPIGTYTVTVTQTGFQTFVTSGVTVDVATERRVDAGMKTGEVSTKVEVSADQLPMVETTTNTLGGVLTAQTVEDMPVNGRDYTKLIYMNPGVSGSPDQISDSPGSFGEFSMNGARGRSNNYLLDGTDMNDGYRNDPAINQAGVFGTPSTILPIDAVAEVNVLSNFQPEYGRNAGAVVNIVTKSGTNAIHGSAAEYFRNSALDARNYFNVASQPKAPFHNNQYGGSLGGALVKDKTFFYLDYEGQEEPVGVVTVAAVPNTGSGPNGQLTPADSSNSVIQALLARNPWPAPNLSNGSASVVSPSFNKLSSIIGKIDQNFNASNILTGRYFFGDSVQSFPLALTATGGQLPGFNTYTPTRVQLVSLSYTHTIGSNKVNELRYGWNRFAEGFLPADQTFHPGSIGLCAATDATLCNGKSPFDSGLPIIQVSGYSQLGATSSVPRHRFDSNNQALDNFSWKINKHDVKVGVDFHRTSVQQYFDKYFRGRLRFKDQTGSGGLSPIGNFLAGNVTDGFQYFGDSTRHTYENNFGFYVQDSFRATSRLTLNYGLRWDYFGVVKEKNNLLSNITSVSPAPGTGTFTLTQVGQPGLGSLYNPDKKDFAPRVSAAWDVTGKGKTVIRAGFGLFYDAFSQDMVLGHLPYAPFYDPGPAYNNVGPDPIRSASAFGGKIIAGSPLYNAAAPCTAVECDSFGFDRNIKTPYMENYNLNIQQQLSGKAVLQLGYVGSQGHHLWRFFDISQPSTAQINAADIACNCIQDFGGAARPLNGNPYGSFIVLQENSTGKSNYNALQASLRITGWHGVSSIVNYVYSKSLDNSSDGEDFEPNAAQPNDSTNPQLEYGPSNFNIPHRFTWNFSYDFPTMGGNMQKLKNGWGINSVTTLQSGQPFHLNYNFQDDFSGSGNAFDRPDVVGPIVYHKREPFNYLDLSSFAIPCTVNGVATTTASDCVIGTRHFGNMGRNSLSGPTFKEWNFSIYKKTQLTERLSMKLGVDFFNILNHPNFANPLLPAFIADAAGGANLKLDSTGTREVGSVPLAITATGDVGIGNPFIGGGGPRGIQLAAVFKF
jgi:hypothetical protein